MITGHVRTRGIQIGIIGNHRGMVRAQGAPPRFGEFDYRYIVMPMLI